MPIASEFSLELMTPGPLANPAGRPDLTCSFDGQIATR
jgi:hypothetical protein